MNRINLEYRILVLVFYSLDGNSSQKGCLGKEGLKMIFKESVNGAEVPRPKKIATFTRSEATE